MFKSSPDTNQVQHKSFHFSDPFLKSPETFRPYFKCHNSLYILGTPRSLAIKLCNPLGFSYIKDMLKDSAFQNKWIAVFQLGFQVRKILETFVKQDPGLAENGRELGQKW